VQEIDLARIAVALIFFVFASISDWRTRRVGNITWIALGAIAFGLFWLDLMQRNAPLVSQSLLLPTLFLFVDIFWDRKKDIKTLTGSVGVILYILSFSWVAYVGYSVLTGTTAWDENISGPMVAFAMVVVFELFYMLDVIKGGADAKAVICLAVLFPWYPSIVDGLPLIKPTFDAVPDFFTFALSVLFVGALISLVMPLSFLARNIKSGNKISGRSFLGFMLPIDKVEGQFVWLIEWVEDGQLRFSARKMRDSASIKEDLAALRAMGKDEVWVTYKIPFIIPLTIGMAVVLVLGNPLFLLY
jgi:preflagellin peptidase FlaK